MKNAKTIINESGIMRIIAHNQEHDCAILTAYRSARGKAENAKLNATLGYALNKLGYGTTKVVGTYEEAIAGQKSKEASWFAVNLKDDPDFTKNIENFGKSLEQDSVFIIPKGGFFNPKSAYLLGTNNNDFCPLGKKICAKAIKFGKTDSKMLTNVNGRPFYFTFTDILREDFLLMPVLHTLQAMRLVDEAAAEMISKSRSENYGQ